MKCIGGFAVALWVMACFPATAQQGQIEPEAIQALNRMSTYLRSLKAFQVEADVTTEDVLEDGQKVQYAHHTNMVARMPDRLMARVEGDRRTRIYLYNGKTFTLFVIGSGYYASTPAPPTIYELASLLDNKYNIEVPLMDLFLWSEPQLKNPEISAASDIGASEVGGVSCEHYAFRQPGLDWQVWIQKGDYPLPRKIVLTTTTDEARPQHVSVLTWNLAPSFNEAAFNFSPPPGTHKIVFAEDAASRGRQ